MGNDNAKTAHSPRHQRAQAREIKREGGQTIAQRIREKGRRGQRGDSQGRSIAADLKPRRGRLETAKASSSGGGPQRTLRIRIANPRPAKSRRHTIQSRALEKGDRAKGKLEEALETLAVERELFREQQKQLERAHRESEEFKSLLKKRTLELNRSGVALGYTRCLLETRTQELREAQAYLTKADNISHGDVQRMVEMLNSSIFQVSAQIVHDYIFDNRRRNAGEMEESFSQIERRLGHTMAQLLIEVSHVEDVMWVQAALQALLTAFANGIATSWNIAHHKKKYSLLTNIYQELYKREPQAVSAKWRTLARRSIQDIFPDGDILQKIERCTTRLVNVLLISGAQDVEERSTLPRSYYIKVEDIADQSLKLQRAIGEEVTSSDFYLIRPTRDTPFASESMKDMDDCGQSKSDGVSESACRQVLCTTSLGLRRLEKVRRRDGEDEVVASTVIKAEVFLKETSDYATSSAEGMDSEVEDLC